jgi:hypothetical protein
MSATSLHLSLAGRLQLVNFVISSLPTYYMCTLKIPITVIEISNKYRKTTFRGGESSGQRVIIWLPGVLSEGLKPKVVSKS